jgi:DNA-binding MarR family transcriptional regulator
MSTDDRVPRNGGRRANGSESELELPAIWHVFGNDAIAPRLLLLAKMIDRVASRKLHQGFGISVAQWRVLAFICMSGEAPASLIGEAAEADPAEISRAVKRLVEQQLVTREFEPGNRKTMLIVPTAKGRELFAEVRRQRQEYFSRIVKRLPLSAKTALTQALTQIAEEVVVERSESDLQDAKVRRH